MNDARWTASRRRVALMLAGGVLLRSLPAPAAERIKVVATFSVIGDMVANVGGDMATLTTIVGAGGDCELYQPTVADAKTVAEAGIVFANGLNDEFEPWLDPLLKRAGFRGRKILVSRNARTITAEEEGTARSAALPAAIDQHAWLDPKNGIIYVGNIAEALARADPANADGYRKRAEAYAGELRKLDAWAARAMAAVPQSKRRIIASHDSLQYLARAFRITLISANGWTNNSEASAADLARLAAQVRDEKVRALFLDSITDPRAMQRVAAETGASLGGTLYADALSKPGGEADSYLAMLRHDVATLKAGMLKN